MLAGVRAIPVSSPSLPALARLRLFLRQQLVPGRVPVVGRVVVSELHLRSLRGPEQELVRCLHSFRPFFWRRQLERQIQKAGDYAVYGNAEMLCPAGISGPIRLDSLKDHGGVKHPQEFSADIASGARAGCPLLPKAKLQSVLDFLGSRPPSLGRCLLEQFI